MAIPSILRPGFYGWLLYRMKYVVRQVGRPAFILSNLSFLVAINFGVAVAHAISPGAGAGLLFGLLLVNPGRSAREDSKIQSQKSHSPELPGEWSEDRMMK